ncbi:alpha-(1-_3)-arabinofuranosyltransferase family protein [Janibacter sp. DB-40]|uniref:alpha-(1->3)-arabinofuranosyltransferase domain-containing protein n=1 Tax=Janibacter sp. DB-40 TaxID=3028808 RepID=UPI002404FCEE|nr:alpha-(1->3)-arabinofuranosyltransferase family protein [Janibacter sp. DB-40]
MRSRLRLPRAVSVRAVSVILLVLLAVIVFANSWGVFQTDIKPEVYLNPGGTLPRYLSAWTSSPYLGSPNFNVGLVPVLATTALLRGVGLDPEMAFKVYHLVLWALAAWGANRLLRTLVPGAGVWAGLLAGVAYIANPYAVAAGSTLAVALPMALLPWLLLAVTKSLRDPSGWVWPAAVGLVFFGMSGMNVGVVPVYQLLLIIPVALYVRAEQGLAWSRVAVSLGKSALFVIVVSLYWLIPGAAASETGSRIAAGSESLDGIARTSSFVEVLRGLGLWSYYGSGDAGPWLPQFAPYFASAVIILLTMLWPALALLSLRVVPTRLARLSAVATGMVAVIMVGIYPGGNGGSPFAAVLRWALEDVGPLVAFRTTNKIGAGLALAFALVIGWALTRLVPGMVRRPGGAPILGTLGTATVLALVAPAVSGNLYVSELDVPDYWQEAADAVDTGDPNHRALLLPGQTRSDYRWSPERPDDLPNSLLERDAVIPETVPNTSQWGGNYLAALSSTLQSGTSGSTDVSPFARYLGVDHVLLRHDVEWEDSGGARPAHTAQALSEDEGLQGLRNFGRSGQNMFTRSVPPQSQSEALLPPLQLYGVKDSRGMVRATPATGSVVVAGDAWAIPPMAQQGILEGSPAMRYAQDLSTKELRRLLEQDSRMVLTDTNQRREAITNRLTANQGAVLPPEEEPVITRALGGAEDQSTLAASGVLVEATSEGGAFFDLPHGMAENAVDGDPSTSWLFGDFRRAEGESLTLRLPQERTLDTVTIDTTALGDASISAFDVRAGDVARTVEVDEEGTATVDLGGVRTDEVELTVADLQGEGVSLVGVAEIDLGDDDLVAERAIETPDTFSRLYGDLSADERQAFGELPLDVLFTRVDNTSDPGDDTETQLSRNFTLPDDRTFDVAARVRVRGDLELVADRLSGKDDTYRARSSRTYFDSLARRASQAADRSTETAWVPGGDLTEAWWQVTGPRRDISRVTVTQEPGPGDEDDTAWATTATVLVDGEEVATGDLGPGTDTIELPPGTNGESVRLRIDEVDESRGDRPASFVTIDTGATVTGSGTERPCVAVATLDGEPVRMRPEDPEQIGGTGGYGTPWVGCGEQSLVWGEHRLRPVEDFQLDELSLRDVGGSEVAEEVSSPVVEVERETFTSAMTVDVGRAQEPYFLSIGQGFDPRWNATLEDGTDLGEPVVVDGYAVGWYVDDLDEHTVHIGYGPQRRANVALVLSGVGLLVALAIVFAPLVRRRVSSVRAERESEWSREPAAQPAPSREDDAFLTGDVPGDDPFSRPGTPRAATTGAESGPDVPRRPVTRGLAEVLRRRRGGRRLAAEVVLVLGTAAVTGIGGGLAALAVVLLARRTDPRPGLLITVGSGLVLLSAVVFVLYAAVVTDTLGTVDADAVKSALVPHHIAGAGLVLAVLGTFMRHDEPEEPDP